MRCEPTNIISRIAWCRHQQQLHLLTQEERAGWRAEEDGLMDALFGRNRMASMRETHRSQLARYHCGLEDGMNLLRFSTSTPRGMTGKEGLGATPLTTQDWVDSRPVQASPPVESRP
jgi:hypothetical protein